MRALGTLLCSLKAVGCVFLIAAGAHGEDARPRATLTYESGPELPGCPDRKTLENEVSAQLGYDPFRGGGVQVIAKIRARRVGLVATVQAKDEANVSLGRRELTSERGDCAELGRALALAVSVAIDPFAAMRERSPQEGSDRNATLPAPPTQPVVEAPAQKPPAPESPDPELPVAQASKTTAGPYEVVLGTILAFGAVPEVRPQFLTGVSWRFARWARVYLDLRASLPATAGQGRAEARATATSLHAFACAGPELWGLCAGGAQGVLIAKGSGVDAPRSEVGFIPALSAFAYVRGAIGARWFVDGFVGTDVLLTQAALEVNRAVVWTTPRLSPWAGVTFGMRLP